MGKPFEIGIYFIEPLHELKTLPTQVIYTIEKDHIVRGTFASVLADILAWAPIKQRITRGGFVW